MRSTLIAARARLLAALGRTSMYRLVLLALGALTLVAFAVSFTGQTSAKPIALVLSVVVLLVSVGVVDAVAHRLLGRPVRWESGAITALILVFVLYPSAEPVGLLTLGLAGAVASASKYLLAWRGRHVFNPAALGAAAVTVTGLSGSMWWVGTPLLAAVVVVLGLAVAWRAEKLRVALIFVLVALVVSYVRTVITVAQYALPMTQTDIVSMVALSSPVLFAGFFMITEPLTLPTKPWQQVVVAVLAGALFGWPLAIGSFVMLPEVALLVANLVAFAFAVRMRRGGVLTVASRRSLGDRTQEVSFAETLAFAPGQYIEIEVGHRRPDARGTRREFSIVSAVGEPLRIAYRVPDGRHSTFKTALATREPGSRVATTGVHGDFTLHGDAPVLMVAAGIGVTPFVSQLTSGTPDAVLVYVVSTARDVPYGSELASARVILVAPDAADVALPEAWTPFPARITAETLPVLVPDLTRRDALISGPPRLIADLAPALRSARSVRTDAFAGY